MSQWGIAIVAGILLFGAPAARAADGKALYGEHCAGCHGDDGRAQTKKGKAIKARSYFEDKDKIDAPDGAQFVLKSVREKKKHKEVTKKVSDEDLAAITPYIQSLLAK